MKSLSPFVIGLSLITLAACTADNTPEPDPNEQQSSQDSVPETKNVLYRGTIREGGVGIFMQGTHTLELSDGRFILLESSTIDLDDYLDIEADVFGAIRPTVEAGGQIMRVERVTSLEQPASSSSSSSSSADESSSSSEAAVSSIAPAPVQTSSRTAPTAASSKASVADVSSSSEASVPQQTGGQVDARAATMAKDNLAEANWTQEYCSTHIGFCIPVHKNWWFTSFGTTTSTLWHVEIAPEEIANLGDGPLTVNLISGALEGTSHTDGQVVTEGSATVGYRAWTNNRHFEIRGPSILEGAIRHLTEHLRPS